MILGRPTNLWLGFTTAIGGFIGVVALAAGVDPTLVAQLVSAGGAVVGALIVLVANGPATVNQGDTINGITPKGQPNKTLEVK